MKLESVMRIGSFRVSREEQNEQLQSVALNKCGCDKIYQEKVSGASKLRLEFEHIKEMLRKATNWSFKILKLFHFFGKFASHLSDSPKLDRSISYVLNLSAIFKGFSVIVLK